MRKFFLTGVVCIAWRDQRAQLIFGELACLTFLTLHIRLRPYRDRTCDALQFVVLLQLFLTYSFGLLYHAEADDIAEAVEGAEGMS